MDGVRADIVFWFFWSPPGSAGAQGPEGRAVHSSAGDHQPTQGTSGTPSYSCPESSTWWTVNFSYTPMGTSHGARFDSV